MPAATLEQTSGDRTPVFVSDGHRRTHAVRVGGAGLGLLLAAWLVALAAGLVGFTPLPELALPGTGAARTAPAPTDRASQPGAERNAGRHASPIARRASAGGGTSSAKGGSAANASGGRTLGATGGGAQTGSVRNGTPSASPSGTGSSQPQPTGPSPGTAAHGGSGSPPSFTPPASGAKSADPPRGDSADAPGSTVSSDPPGKATRTHSG
jgi:hypothetical protein